MVAGHVLPHSDDGSDHFMPGHHVRFDIGKFPFDDMEVGAAHPTHMNPHENLIRTRFG
jgi:hypothetical protein